MKDAFRRDNSGRHRDGAKVPLMLTSRSAPPAGRLISAAIAVLLHQHWDSDGVAITKTMTGDEP